MSYIIKPYSLSQAKKLNVTIKPSTNNKKKIDVYKDGKKIASIGDKQYKDYPTYLLEDKALANERRRLYKIRHKNDLNKGAGYLANKLLW